MECREIEVTYKRAKKTSQMKLITMAEDVYELSKEFLTPEQRDFKEYYFVIHCNRGGRVLGVQKVSEGGTAATIVDIKIILATALKTLAHGIILVHNHPSGTLRPSVDDDKITKKIVEAAKLFGIKVNDHVIIGDEGYYSYRENGRI